MTRFIRIALLAAALGGFAGAAYAADGSQPPTAPSSTPASGKALTVDSTIGALIDNPKTDAVLKAEIPDTRNGKLFTTVGRDITLRAMAQYDDTLTPAKLKEIDAALAKAQAGG